MKLLATFLLGSGLFVGTALGMLALQGRLNYEGTKGLPVVHSLFDPPPAPEEGEEAGAEEEGAEGAEPEPAKSEAEHAHEAAHAPKGAAGMAYNIGRSVNPGKTPGGEPLRVGEEPPPEEAVGKEGARGHGPKEAAAHPGAEGQHAEPVARHGEQPYRPGRLFEFPTIRAGISVAELNEMLREAKAARERAKAELATIEKRKRDLDAREADIKEREEQILAKIREIEQMRAKLEEKIADFQRTVTMIRADEARAIKSDAETLAAFEPRFASQLIQQWWRSEEGQRRVVKIMALMDGEAANAILQTMDPAQAREILDKRAKVVRPGDGR